MSKNYDNWERLVAAVLRRELLWQICHEHSRNPSLISSVSSDFSSSFSLTSPHSSTFANPEDGIFMSEQKYPPLQVSANVRASVTSGKAGYGLVHLHRKWRGKFSHGNIKASNIFLNSDQYGCISDTTVTTSPTSNYDPPEVLATKKTSEATDVYTTIFFLLPSSSFFHGL
ncbi:UNVERIFIED_CONTAM: putative inactive receptor kinase [Sesamum calycinum]|uniref:Inactive receptor kinase n=2 Tax=Sesamum TaxID=4181 RepID=A0AAW2LRU7_9LAMI